ncbi:hypothetical protein ACODNH_04915 [Haloarcula sp. NS06]|uniref:hypothetical protein n=1 Tax=Haloarcula sp. NS06 TaxID=3409688 RepID=UPI003DA6F9E8
MSTIAAKRADRSTDGMFAFVLGLFVALLAVGPTVTATAVWGGVGADAALYIVALLTVAVVTGLGWLATWRRPGLAVALGGSQARWLPLLFGASYATAALFFAPEYGALALVGFFFGMLAAVVPGLAMGFITRSRYTDVILSRRNRVRIVYRRLARPRSEPAGPDDASGIPRWLCEFWCRIPDRTQHVALVGRSVPAPGCDDAV